MTDAVEMTEVLSDSFESLEEKGNVNSHQVIKLILMTIWRCRAR